MKNMLHDQVPPARIMRSASPIRRVDARISAMAMSAVASTSTPGVFVHTTPRRAQAATSMLS